MHEYECSVTGTLFIIYFVQYNNVLFNYSFFLCSVYMFNVLFTSHVLFELVLSSHTELYCFILYKLFCSSNVKNTSYVQGGVATENT